MERNKFIPLNENDLRREFKFNSGLNINSDDLVLLSQGNIYCGETDSDDEGDELYQVYSESIVSYLEWLEGELLKHKNGEKIAEAANVEVNTIL
jgi:hypothetical protein